jgi:carbamoylphosphate synthase large subunit
MQQSSGGDAAANSDEIKQMIRKMQDQIVNMNVSLQYSTYGDKGEKIEVTVV